MNVGPTFPMRLLTFDAASAIIRFLNKRTYIIMFVLDLPQDLQVDIIFAWMGDAATIGKCIMALECRADEKNNLIIILQKFFSVSSLFTSKTSIGIRILLANYFLKQSISLSSIEADKLSKHMKELLQTNQIESVVIHRWSILNLIVMSKQRKKYKLSMNENEIDLFMEDANRYDKKWLRDVFNFFSPQELSHVSKKLMAFLSSEQDSDKKKAMELFQIFSPLMTQEEIAAFLDNISMLAYSSETSKSPLPFDDFYSDGELSDTESIDFEKDHSVRYVAEDTLRYVAEETFVKTFHYLHDDKAKKRLMQRQNKYFEEKLNAILLKRSLLPDEINAPSLDQKLELFFNYLMDKIDRDKWGGELDLEFLSRYLLVYSNGSVNKFFSLLLMIDIDIEWVYQVQDVYAHVVSYLTSDTIDSNSITCLTNKFLTFKERADDYGATAIKYEKALIALKYFSYLISFVSLKEKIQLLRCVYPDAVKNCNDHFRRFEKEGVFDCIEIMVKNIFNSGGGTDLCDIAMEQVKRLDDSLLGHFEDISFDEKLEDYELLSMLIPYVNNKTKRNIAMFFYSLLNSTNNTALKMGLLYFRDIRNDGLEEYFSEKTGLVRRLWELLYSKPGKSPQIILEILVYFIEIQTVAEQSIIFLKIKNLLNSGDIKKTEIGLRLLIDFIKFFRASSVDFYYDEISRFLLSKEFEGLPGLLDSSYCSLLLDMVSALSYSDFYDLLSSKMINSVLHFLNEDMRFLSQEEKKENKMLVLDMLTVLIIRNAAVCDQFPVLEGISRTEKIMLAKTQEQHVLTKTKLGVFAHKEDQVAQGVHRVASSDVPPSLNL